jgi:hypothetical protein
VLLHFIAYNYLHYEGRGIHLSGGGVRFAGDYHHLYRPRGLSALRHQYRPALVDSGYTCTLIPHHQRYTGRNLSEVPEKLVIR